MEVLRITTMQIYSSDEVIEEFYEAIASGDPSRVKRVHIPKSDVFYVREAYYQKSGQWETLDRIERCMYLEGMLKASEVFEPNRKRDWEDVPTGGQKQKEAGGSTQRPRSRG